MACLRSPRVGCSRPHATERAVEERAAEAIRLALEERAQESDATVPDERLALLFVCAHPAIDAAVRTPLMLQVVLGLRAEDVARAFLASPAAMAKRLVRAKRKLAEARIPFERPAPTEFSERLGSVLDAIYAAYGRS
jgi:RNA polymerase sigma-70 factor (ECF subfamily)